MFGKLVPIVLARKGSRAVVVGVAATGLVVFAGGLAFASRGALQITPAGLSLASAVANSVRPASGTGSGASASKAATAPTTRPQTPVQAGTVMPAGLLLASTQASADLSLKSESAGSDQSATGGGSTTFFHFGFTAQPHRNGKVAGTVTGNAEFVFVAPNAGHLHVDVNCLQIVGNDAYMSGVLTNSALGLVKGTEILFGVQDNDSVSTPDLISTIFFSPAPPLTCHTFHAKPLFPIQGNIEIH